MVAVVVFILISSFIFIYLFCVWPTISDLGVFVKCIFFTMAFFGAYLVINGKMFG